MELRLFCIKPSRLWIHVDANSCYGNNKVRYYITSARTYAEQSYLFYNIHYWPRPCWRGMCVYYEVSLSKITLLTPIEFPFKDKTKTKQNKATNKKQKHTTVQLGNIQIHFIDDNMDYDRYITLPKMIFHIFHRPVHDPKSSQVENMAIYDHEATCVPIPTFCACIVSHKEYDMTYRCMWIAFISPFLTPWDTTSLWCKVYRHLILRTSRTSALWSQTCKCCIMSHFFSPEHYTR